MQWALGDYVGKVQSARTIISLPDRRIALPFNDIGFVQFYICMYINTPFCFRYIYGKHWCRSLHFLLQASQY
jgi:hypothetical protein